MIVHQDESVVVHHGDALDVLRDMADCSVDSVVCDPPYGLTDHPRRNVEKALLAWLTGDREHVPNGKGFMGRDWDAFVPPPAMWDECFRVLKPGGHLLAFSAPRTQDLMGISLRLAGLTGDIDPEIRDSIIWINAQGFPKNHDVSKAIDKAAGAEREVVPNPRAAQQTASRGRGETIHVEGGDFRHLTHIAPAPATDDARTWQGWGTALKPAHEPIIVARKPLDGTVAANVLRWGTGALNVDGCRVGTSAADARAMERANTPGSGRMKAGGSPIGTFERSSPTGAMDTTAGRWPPNVVLSPESAAELDRQSGTLIDRNGGRGGWRHDGYVGGSTPSDRDTATYRDSGGASRFFPIFRYEPKAPTSERPTYWRHTCDCEHNQPAARAGSCPTCGAAFKKVAHPTVKPLDLMCWLVRLVTPPGGLVLDWCAGTGTTGEACVLENMRAILIEKDIDSIPLITARLTKPMQVGFDFEGIA